MFDDLVEYDWNLNYQELKCEALYDCYADDEEEITFKVNDTKRCLLSKKK